MLLRRREEKVAWLRRVPLFSDLSTGQLEALTPLIEEVETTPGQVLIQQGEYGQELVIVVEGAVEATRDGEHLRDLGPGDVVGEIALLDGGLRTASITVREPTTVLIISKRAFDTVLHQVPGLPHELLRAMARRLRDATEGTPA
jgi:CRP/FNR family cyclic AMP-dependent transcriptional regulator